MDQGIPVFPLSEVYRRLTVTKYFTKREVRQDKLFGAGVPLWCAFAVGASLMMLFINFGMLRPTQRQLEQLESRVGSLQGTIQQIAGQTGGVEETNSLLGLLRTQQNELATATGVLEELVALKRGLIAGKEKVVTAQHCLNEVVQSYGGADCATGTTWRWARYPGGNGQNAVNASRGATKIEADECASRVLVAADGATRKSAGDDSSSERHA